VPSGASLPNRLPPSAFLYQPERNRCVCPEGKVLHPQGRRQKRPGADLPTATKLKQTIAKPARANRRVCPEKCEARPFGGAPRRKPGGERVSQEDGQRRSASAVPPSWKSRGILPRVDQKQAGAATVSRPRVGEGTNGMLWACLTYNLQHWIRLRKLEAAAS